MPAGIGIGIGFDFQFYLGGNVVIVGVIVDTNDDILADVNGDVIGAMEK
jgi:2C-methyl-D-erythritol 2,4-cyclodiphosphate synthase